MINVGQTVVCIKQDVNKDLKIGLNYIIHEIDECVCGIRLFDVGLRDSFFIRGICKCGQEKSTGHIKYKDYRLFALPIESEMFEYVGENALQEM